jgi:NAD(P)H-dependent FMN reductase
MADIVRILAFAGSTRQESFNKKLARFAGRAAEQAGATVTLIDLREFPLPLFDEDLERSAPPENAGRLRQLFLEHHGLLIASPEYNSSITAVLKNTIDWVSRPAAGTASLAAFKNKVAGLVSASPGALGGLRGLVHLRSILGNIGVIVLPEQAAIPKAADAFAPDGSLIDSKQQAGVSNVAKRLIEICRKMNAS